MYILICLLISAAFLEICLCRGEETPIEVYTRL